MLNHSRVADLGSAVHAMSGFVRALKAHGHWKMRTPLLRYSTVEEASVDGATL
jgi:hypothetical protein